MQVTEFLIPFEKSHYDLQHPSLKYVCSLPFILLKYTKKCKLQHKTVAILSINSYSDEQNSYYI